MKKQVEIASLLINQKNSYIDTYTIIDDKNIYTESPEQGYDNGEWICLMLKEGEEKYPKGGFHGSDFDIVGEVTGK